MSGMRDEIIRFLDDYLQVANFRDYCPNGLQVIGRPAVERVALAVSANLECFRLAAEGKADMLIAHHGLFWENTPPVVGAMLKARLKTLFEHDITLLGYHLPLDAHPVVGNNALWLQELGFALEDINLGVFRGRPIGAIGNATQRQTLREVIEKVTHIAGGPPRVYAYGPQTVRRVGVVTGGGYHNLLDATALGCDTFITGETGEPTEGVAREEGINFIGVGHYNSERLGVQALGKLLQTHFGVTTFFCEVPNPV